MSSITVIGNLTRDPEIKYLGSGTTVANFTVASNRRFMKNDQWEEVVSFFDVVCFKDLADNVCESLEKGDRVVVSGHIEQRSWEDSKTGEKRSKMEVTADEVAPSLRWASAEVTRNERGATQGAQRPQAKAEPQKQEGWAGGSGGGWDEEPFDL